jgi:hypothetical protein
VAEKVEQLPAFRISSAVLTDGEVHVQGMSGQDGADIRIDHLNLYLDNLTNSTKLAPSLMAKALAQPNQRGTNIGVIRRCANVSLRAACWFGFAIASAKRRGTLVVDVADIEMSRT